jgi:hypothetical protein
MLRIFFTELRTIKRGLKRISGLKFWLLVHWSNEKDNITSSAIAPMLQYSNLSRRSSGLGVTKTDTPNLIKPLSRLQPVTVAGELRERFQILFARIADNIFRKRRSGGTLIPINGNQVVSDILFVETLLRSAGLVRIFGPETRRIRR